MWMMTVGGLRIKGCVSMFNFFFAAGDATLYDACVAESACRVYTAKVSGATFFPAPHPTYADYRRLFNGQTTTVSSPVAAFITATSDVAANTSTTPYIQLQLNQTYDTLSAVSIWPPTDPAWTRYARGLTIWLHALPDFTTDPAAVKCVTGLVPITRKETLVYCPPTTGINYVTIQRVSTTASTLALQEVRIYTNDRKHINTKCSVINNVFVVLQWCVVLH